mmetsp:Transcript_122492/g.305913  ORF Transcript_122492/g.305913 Transcript_122492/m.305913 type:complete len:246 (-) Transcript_122492:1094-1831(-)
MHWGVHIGEVPFERRKLTIGMHVPLADNEPQLALGKVWVHQGQGEAMEGQIPRRIPGELPLIRHRDDVAVVHMIPIAISDVSPLLGRFWTRRVAFEESEEVKVVELLRPDHACKSLTLDAPMLHVLNIALQDGIEGIGLLLFSCKYLIEGGERLLWALRRQPHLDGRRAASRDSLLCDKGRLGSLVCLFGSFVPVDDIGMESILVWARSNLPGGLIHVSLGPRCPGRWIKAKLAARKTRVDRLHG